MNQQELPWEGWNKYRHDNLFWTKSRRARASLIALYKNAEETVFDLVGKLEPSLCLGRRDVEINESSLARVEKKVSAILPPSQHKIAYRYLNRTLLLGASALGWKIPGNLMVSIILKRSLPHIYHDSNRQKTQARDAIQRLLNHTESYGDMNVDLGKILWSAVLLGGYQGSASGFIYALPHRLITPEGRVHLQFGEASQRWFADPISEAFIKLFYKTHDKANLANIKLWRVPFDAAGRVIFSDSGSRHPGYEQTKLIATQLHSDFLPAFLSHPDGYQGLATGLDSHTWERLLYGSVSYIRENSKQNNSARFEVPNRDRSARSFDYIKERQQYYQGLSLFAGKKADRLSPQEIARFIDQAIADHESSRRPPIGLMLLSWASHLILKGNNGKPLRIKSAHDYLCAFGSRLIRLLGLREQTPKFTDEWIDVYNEILDMVPGKSAHVSLLIIRFHSYASSCGWVDPIDDNAVRRYGKSGSIADANLITFDEMDIFLGSFPNETTRKETMQLLIAALGFYCGMRATEILTVRIMDVGDGPYCEIFVGPNEYHDCKSDAARRRIPIWALLPTQVLDELLAFKAERIAELEGKGRPANHRALLFPNPDNPTAVLNYDYIIKPIVNALADITRDQNVRFHHLRHSFANWLLIRLMAPFYPELIGQDVRAFDHSVFSSEGCHAISCALMNSGYPLRPALFQVSNLLGHATPRTTLKSYVHLGEYLSYAILSARMNPDMNTDQICSLLGIKKSTYYNRIKSLSLSKSAATEIKSFL